MIYLGIDPGKTGALAVLRGDGAKVYDCPLTSDRLLDLSAMGALLRSVVLCDECQAMVERVNSFRGEGHMGAFRFGENYGVWQGLLAGLGLNFELVLPRQWQKFLFGARAPLKAAGAKRDKRESLALARKLFPELRGELRLAKHHGRAEALLIAEYGRRKDRSVRDAGWWNAIHW